MNSPFLIALVSFIFYILPYKTYGQFGLSIGGNLGSQTEVTNVTGRLTSLQMGSSYRFFKTRLIQPLVELNYEGRGYKRKKFIMGGSVFSGIKKVRLHYLALNVLAEIVPQKSKGVFFGGGMSFGYLLYAKESKGNNGTVTERYSNGLEIKVQLGYALKTKESESIRISLSTFRSLYDVSKGGKSNYNHGDSIRLQYQF